MHMQTRTRALKFTAVLTFVVLSLTGFSTGRHHSRHGSGGGGGCSSSHQDHDSSSSSSTSGGSAYGDDYGSSGTSTTGSTSGGYHTRRPTHRATATPSGSGSDTALQDGEAKLISCATAKRPYATVEVSNPNGRKATFTVDVLFMADADSAIDSDYLHVTVPAKGKKTVKAPFSEVDHFDLLDHCEVSKTALLAS